MTNEIRKTLQNLRSGIYPQESMSALASFGKDALRDLAKELRLQSQSSLFTGTLLQIIGQITGDNTRLIRAGLLKDIVRETRQFIPQSVSGPDREQWAVANVERLGIQVRRSRYQLKDPEVVRAEQALKASQRSSGERYQRLADVLDGDLDAVEDQKEAYVERVVDFFFEAAQDIDPRRALATARILGCFGALSGGAVPGIIDLLQQELDKEDGDIDRTCLLLESLERIGFAAIPAIPTILEILNLSADTLIREDGIVIRVMDALGSIGETSNDVIGFLQRAASHPAEIISSRAKATLWKLCVDIDIPDQDPHPG